MIRCGDNDHVTGEPVDLEQEGTDDPLDFAGLVGVPPLLGDRIELVEEQHAGPNADCRKQRVQPACGLTKEGPDEPLVANSQERDSHLCSDGFGERGLAAARWPFEQDAMARLDPWLRRGPGGGAPR